MSFQPGASSANMDSCFRSKHFSFCQSNWLAFAWGSNSGDINDFIFLSLYFFSNTLNLDLNKKENLRKRFHDVIPQRSRTLTLKYFKGKKSRQNSFPWKFVNFFLVYFSYLFANLERPNTAIGRSISADED